MLLGNHTHIHYSRLGLTNIWDPFFLLASAALIVIAWQKRGRLGWLAAGLMSGLSFYFYTAGHLLPAIVPLLLITLLFTDELKRVWQLESEKRSLRNVIRSGTAAFALSLIVMLPMLAYYNRTPGRFTDRLIRQGVIQTNWIEYQGAATGQSTAAVWRGQILDSLSLLSLSGVPDLSVYYGSDLGLITLMPTILFLGGFFLIVLQARRAENQMLLWIFAITVFGAGVLLLDPPQSHRYLILIPMTALCGGIALQWLAELYNKEPAADLQKWLLVAVIAVASISIVPDLRYYFGTWQEEQQFTDRNTEIAFEIASYLNGLPENSTVYLQTEPVLNSSFPTIGYLAPQFRRAENLIELPILNGAVPTSAAEGRTVFVVLPERANELALLRQNFPDGRSVEISGSFSNPLFTVFEVES